MKRQGKGKEKKRKRMKQRRENRNPPGSVRSLVFLAGLLYTITSIQSFLSPIEHTYKHIHIHIEKYATQTQTTTIQWQETALRYSACILVKKKVGWNEKKAKKKKQRKKEVILKAALATDVSNF